MELTSYEKGLQLRVMGIEKRIQDWSVSEGAIGKDFTYDLSNIDETHSFNTSDVSSGRIGNAILETIQNNIFVEFDTVSIGGDGYITVTVIEDGEARQVDDSTYKGKMYICDYEFGVTINGIDVSTEDLEEILVISWLQL